MPAIRDLPDLSREAIEIEVQKAWGKALGVKSVGRDDDFYKLGGHSLQAARTLLDLGEALGVTPVLPGFVGKTTPARVADAFWEMAQGQRRP